MTTNKITWYVWCYVICTLLSFLCDGNQFVSALNNPINMMGYQIQVSSGLVGVLVVGVNFLSQLIPRLVLWDYGFFQYSPMLEVLRYILILVFGSGLIYGLYLAAVWLIKTVF